MIGYLGLLQDYGVKGKSGLFIFDDGHVPLSGADFYHCRTASQQQHNRIADRSKYSKTIDKASCS